MLNLGCTIGREQYRQITKVKAFRLWRNGRKAFFVSEISAPTIPVVWAHRCDKFPESGSDHGKRLLYFVNVTPRRNEK